VFLYFTVSLSFMEYLFICWPNLVANDLDSKVNVGDLVFLGSDFLVVCVAVVVVGSDCVVIGGNFVVSSDSEVFEAGFIAVLVNLVLCGIINKFMSRLFFFGVLLCDEIFALLATVIILVI